MAMHACILAERRCYAHTTCRFSRCCAARPFTKKRRRPASRTCRARGRLQSRGPAQPILIQTPVLEQGIARRLSRLLRSFSGEFRLSPLCRFKNPAYKCPPAAKRAIMTEVGWPPLDTRQDDAGVGLRGQAFYLVRNFMDCEKRRQRGV